MNPDAAVLEQMLKETLRAIRAIDEDYPTRYRMVLIAMSVAEQLGMRTGYRFDPAEPEWPVAVIELPVGQVNWHMPQFPDPGDGHTTEEKYRRIAEYAPDDSVPLERFAAEHGL